MNRSYYDTKVAMLKHSYQKPEFIQSIPLTPVQTYTFNKSKDCVKDNIFKILIRAIKSLFKKKKKPVEPVKPVKPVEQVAPNPIGSPFIKTLTSYCGCDAVILLNGKCIGELQNMTFYNPSELEVSMLKNSDYYDKDLAVLKPVVIMADKVLFGHNGEDKSFDEKENYDIVVTYANEYGQSHYFSIYDAQVLHKMSSTDIDSVMIVDKICLCAKQVTNLKPSVRCQE